MTVPSQEDACTCRVCGAAIPDRPPVICPACLIESSIGFRRVAPGSFALPEPEILSAAIPGIDVVGLIGQGGMGAVYLGEPEDGGKPVAVKVLAPKFSDHPELRKRFEREAQILASLDHPGIVRLHKSGESGKILYLVMDFIEGTTLDHEPPRPVETTIKMGIALCEALAYAHDRGIAHRDLKPSNILLDHDTGTTKIADFGLAKPAAVTAEATLLTSLNQSLGTPRYMAPEQWDGRGADARSDIYALAAILYERLTGTAPSGSFKKPSAISGAPRSLDAPIMKALAADPEERFATAAEFSAALKRPLRPKKKPAIFLTAAALVAACLYFLTTGNEQDSLTPIEINSDPAITSPRTTTHNYLGRFLSADDDLIVVGAPCASETTRISGSGYALVYRPSGTAKGGDFQLGNPIILESPAPETGDRFAYNVSHSQDTIVCGAWGTNGGKGAAYIFSADGKSLQTLIPPAGNGTERYGFDVAIDGDTLAVSTPGTGSDSPGHVFVYERKAPDPDFILTTTLSPRGISPDARFGRCIALDGGFLAVACYNYSDREALSRGAAFIYQKDSTGSFGTPQKLVPERSRAGDHYGTRISLGDGWLVLNAWKADIGQRNSGASAVFQFQNGRWRERQTLSAGTRATSSGQFGSGAWVGGGILLASASHTRTRDGDLVGDIYTYTERGDRWKPDKLFRGSGVNRFGTTTALSRGMILAGANFYDRWRGGVWMFPLNAD